MIACNHFIRLNSLRSRNNVLDFVEYKSRELHFKEVRPAPDMAELNIGLRPEIALERFCVVHPDEMVDIAVEDRHRRRHLLEPVEQRADLAAAPGDFRARIM